MSRRRCGAEAVDFAGLRTLDLVMAPAAAGADVRGREAMSVETFQARLAELRAKMRGLSAEQQAAIEGMFEEAGRRFQALKHNRARQQAAIEDWRLIVNYVLFDLEIAKAELARSRPRRENGEGR